MNRIYNIIWSKTKKSYIVVSELVKSGRGKNGVMSERKNTPFRTLLCVLAIMGWLIPGMAEASFSGGTGASVYGANSIAVGDNAQTTKEYTVALGSRTQATDIYAIAIGDQAKATGQGATAIGSLSLSTALHSLAVGDQSHATGQDSSAYGLLSEATGLGSVALGTVAKATNANTVAIGNTSSATGLNSIGVGSLANAAGMQSVVVGRQASSDATADNSIAIGQGAKASGQKRMNDPYSASTIAIGNVAKAMENGDVVIGRQATSTVSEYHYQSGSGAVVMGSEAASYGSRGDVVLGSGAEANIIRKGTTNPANTPEYSQSIAIGSMAKVYGTQAMAIGGDALSIGHSSIAIGGNDIDQVKSQLLGAVPNLLATGVQKKFERETAALYPGTTLGSAALSTSQNYMNTASIGGASIAMGAMSQSFGIGSTAIGVNSLTKGIASIGIGVMARSWGENSLAIGSQAGAYGNKSTSVGYTNKVGFDMTDGTVSGDSSVAVGTDNNIYGNNSYVIGSENTVGSATVTGTTETNGDKITTVTAGTVKGNMAGAFGYKNSITADNSYVVGSNSTVSADGAMILGNNSSVTAKNGMGLGNNTKVDNENAVALGSSSETAAAVATPSATINGTVHNFAGTSPSSTVSVGKAGMERTVTNVAAGRISATSTDAINGSQLYAVTSEMDKGVAYAGDVKAASATANAFTRKLGEQTKIVGGVTDATKLTDNNIGVVSNGTDTLNVKLAKTLTGLDSVTAGNTTISNSGLTVGGNTYVTSNGINANNQKITNVADGNVASGSKDAVNGGQLNDAKNEVINKGITFDANTGGEKTNKLGSKVTIKGDGSNINAAITQVNGDTTINMTLGDIVKIGSANPVTIDGTAGTVTGLTNTAWNADNPQAVSGRGATEDQLQAVNTKVNTNKDQIDKNKQGIADNKQNITNNTQNIANNAGDIATNKNNITTINQTLDKGLDFAGDTGTVSNRKLGDTVTIKGGATGTLSDGNIGVESDGSGTLNVKLAKTLTGLDSVTAGNTTINNGGLTVGGKTYVTSNGIDANNQKITNVADGNVASGSKDAVNGGQLHDAKNELNTNINNAKTEVINKGLRFDADNNSEKTNKLGSKVTVKGDNNITTDITQTGDDTIIGVKLNQDINVKTVTATDTVKADGVTMGSQTSGGTTGNYVTGLGNTTWNVTNPTAVSGRAATEDQLQTITKAINDQSAAATDYRLVKNAAAADGAYTVDSNGDVALTVQDKNHTDKTETVTIKDVASKSKLDDVITKGLQFDANTGGTKTNKLGSKITVKGEGTAADADYSGENLKTFISQDADGNTTIDVKMNKNLKAETIVATGKDGKDGKIGINGKDGVTTNISVTRDGQPGVDGAAGTTTTRIVYQKPDGTNEEVATLNDGMKYGGDTGTVIKKKLNEQVNVIGGITDASKLTDDDNLGVVSDGSNNLKVRLAKALKGLESVTVGDTFINNTGMTINNGTAGNPVSLTKDGLNNGGNTITNVAAGVNGTDAVNVNQLKDVAGEASKHTTVKAKDTNVTVTEGTNAAGGKEYTVGLADKVTLGTDPTKQVSIDGTAGTIKAGDKVEIDGNKGTIKAGNVTIDGENGTIKAGDKVTIDGNTGKIDAGKVTVDGDKGTVNGLTNKTWDPNNITSGQAATEDQLQQSHNSLDQKITNLGDDITKKGMNFAGNEGEFHRDLGEKVTIKGEGEKVATEYSGENIRTFADANGNVVVKMDKNLKADSLAINGQNGQDGATIKGGTGKAGVDGTNITRLVIEEKNGTQHDIATLDDGMKYGGDTGTVIKKQLNEQVNVVGGITDTSKLTTEDNLGVVSDGSNNLKVRMAKDLKGLNTVTTQDTAGNTTVVNGGGVTITPAGGSTVSLTKDGLDNGGNKITNIGPGVNGTDAVNVNQLKGATDGMANAINEVAGETQRVGAHAAALSALKPIQYDPLEPTQVMAGIGNYRGETAAALGIAHYTAEDTMFHVGMSVGSHHNMINAGVTRKFGTSDAKKAVPERYKGGPISSVYVLQDEVTALKAENARMKESLDKLSTVKEDNEQMKAQIALLMQQAGLTK